MKQQINGIKYLNKNDYEEIFIRENNKQSKIDIKSFSKQINTISIKPSFYDSIKNKSHEECIIEIINHYLRNTRISSITTSTLLPWHEGLFEKIEGSRNLYLQLLNKKIYKSIPKNILNKYIFDRNNFINSCINNTNDINIYYDDNNTSYKINDNSIVLFTLVDTNYNIYKFEENFIKYVIETKLNNETGYARISHIGFSDILYNPDISERGFYILCDTLKIRINNSILNLAKSIVDAHNKNLNNDKKLQLSLFD